MSLVHFGLKVGTGGTEKFEIARRAQGVVKKFRSPAFCTTLLHALCPIDRRHAYFHNGYPMISIPCHVF